MNQEADIGCWLRSNLSLNTSPDKNMAHNEQTHSGSHLVSPLPTIDWPERQLTRWQIIGIWAAVTLPLAILAWFVVLIVVDQVKFPAVTAYWLVLIVGMAWQTVVSIWVILCQEGNLRWETIRRATWLTKPHDPKTGEPGLRSFWRVPLVWPVLFVCLGLGVLMPFWLLLMRKFNVFDYSSVTVLQWPAYANITELASPEFAQQWWMVILVSLGWVWSALFAEEFLFRGILLPRMSRVFSKRDWIANAMLYALYSLYQYWMIPFRLVEGLILARQARRFSSNWITVAIRSIEGFALLVLVLLGVNSKPLTASPTPIRFSFISRYPTPFALYRGSLTKIPVYNPASGAPFQVDLRGANLSNLDLRNVGNNLVYADFDTLTTWPSTERMPVGFDPTQIIELGKNPGLGLRILHQQGITGHGVGIAIIDLPLLTEHVEYADRLRWYEEIPGSFETSAQMHGSAVASLAVGQTVGVAPGADLYYIGGVGNGLQSIFLQSHDYAQAIWRILQINEQLPAAHKIRVISISSGWVPWIAGYQDVVRAVKEAEAAGMLVINVGTGTGLPNDVEIKGLGRSPMADPDDFDSYAPGIWWSGEFFEDGIQSNMLLVPMDSRAVADTASPDDYMFNRVGGGSWVPPYFAGLYALAVQVDPANTPDRFWSVALRTGRTVQIEHDNHHYSLGIIVDPVALLTELR
jgi:hypothetical protein